MSRLRPLIVVLGAPLLGLVLPPAAAEAQQKVCAPGSRPNVALQYLRRLSLDIRGRAPGVADLSGVVAAGSVADATIDKMLASNEFVVAMRDFHRDLLWMNVVTQRVSNVNFNLQGDGKNQPFWTNANGRSLRYRGDRQGCANQPAKFNGDGSPKKNYFKPPSSLYTGSAKQVAVEGYVMVRPYWSPTTSVKVCAFDAQTAGTGKHYRNNTRVSCSTQNGAQSKECGCGPNMNWCQMNNYRAGVARTPPVIMAAMSEQLLRFSSDIVRRDRPYTDLLLGKDMEVNGPIAHLLKHQTGSTSFFYTQKDLGFAVPNLAYTATTQWVKVQRTGTHAGVLTMPGFLLRFQTNRGRATRFHNAFLCNVFQAPSGGLPPGSDPCNQEPNLMQRCGCKYCHQALEPDSSHWGRWSETGIAPLFAKDFPKYDKTCAKYTGGPSQYVPARCRVFYVTQSKTASEKKYNGQLKAYKFATGDMEKNITAGPAKLARRAIDTGKFGTCIAEKVWTWFTDRSPNDKQTALMIALGKEFAAKKYNFRVLVKALVKSEPYKQGALLAAKSN